MSMVTLTIATDSLRRLPAGASYSERSGQASVKVTRRAATATEPEYIYVYATCDSLQLQCERYERTIRNMHKDYGEQLSGLKIRLALEIVAFTFAIIDVEHCAGNYTVDVIIIFAFVLHSAYSGTRTHNE